MKGGGGSVTPMRFNPDEENTKNGDHALAYTPGKERETLTEPVLSSLNINAISGRPLHKKSQSGKINQANAKQTKQAETPVRAPDGNPTVVWNNAIFQSEEDGGVWDVRSCSSSSDSGSASQSLAEVSSFGLETKEQDKDELHSKVVKKKLLSSLPIPSAESNPEAQNCSPGLESIASSVQIPVHKKQSSAQPMKKVLFITENADQISAAGECGDHEDNIDNGIEEIEKEILRLTEKLEKLKLQQAAKQKNHESQCSSEPQKEVSSPKKTAKGGEPPGPKVEEPKSSEKPRRGRIVSAKFLQWDSSKKEQKTFESGKKGRGGMSPNIQRRAASLGPAEHLRFSQMSGKGKGDEHVMQKLNHGSSRKWSRGTENTKSMDIKMRSLSLSPVPRHRIETKGSNLRPAGVRGSVSARKAGPTPLKDSARSAQWLHPKRLFQASDAKKSIINTNTFSLNSKACPEQPQKPSPCLKNARFVASRYGQALTPSKERATRNPQSSLSSLRNTYGKRFFPDDEFGRMDNASLKRRPTVASSPNARMPLTDKTAVTPRSRTPRKSAARLDPKKKGIIMSKDGKPTGTPAKHGIIGTNSQQKGSSNRTASANTSNLVQGNPLERDISIGNQETRAPDGTKNYCFSAGTKSPDTVERNRMQLPRIRTMRLTAQSPRDSGCIKRAADRVGKKSFFSSDENVTTNSTDLEMAGKSSRREVSDDIKHAFSFEDEAEK